MLLTILGGIWEKNAQRQDPQLSDCFPLAKSSPISKCKEPRLVLLFRVKNPHFDRKSMIKLSSDTLAKDHSTMGVSLASLPSMISAWSYKLRMCWKRKCITAGRISFKKMTTFRKLLEVSAQSSTFSFRRKTESQVRYHLIKVFNWVLTNL